MTTLSEKYRPECFIDVKGQSQAIEMIELFFKRFPLKKALILHGPAGTGKTTLALVLAKEKNLELFELNASDLRNRKTLEEVMGPATQQQALFGKKGKIILVDEVDGVTSVDRGGLTELIALIEKSQFPIIITSNNIWQQKFNLLRRKAEMVKMKEMKYDLLIEILKNIVKKEGKEVGENLLKTIAVKSRGDCRAALNDLQSVLDSEVGVLDIHERDKEEDIFNVLRRVFKDRSDPRLIHAYDSVDMSLDEIFLWIEENIPYEYKGDDLYRAYEALSIADVFRGRVYRQQHWRFLVYQTFLLSAGISFASKKSRSLSDFTVYQRPKRILKIWMQNQRNIYKKSITMKYAKKVHVSKKRAMKEFQVLKPILQNPKIQKELDLDEKEILFLGK